MLLPGLILAGGRSSRMGSPKPLLPVDRKDTFLTRLIRTLCDAGIDEVFVVLSVDGPLDAIKSVLRELPYSVRIVENPHPQNGQLSSLQCGLNVIERPGVDAILTTLVDLPLVSPTTVRTLLDTYTRTRAPIVRPIRPDESAHGHPVIFDNILFNELRLASVKTGAKPIVRSHEAEIVNVSVKDEGAFIDIDTPADYERIFGLSVSEAMATR
jgi:molybdenum cofactor cytidylyltransferase